MFLKLFCKKGTQLAPNWWHIVLSVPWFPQGTVPDGPGHLFVMFLVAFVQVARTHQKTQLCSQFKLQGVLATYWFSAGIEDFSAADVWTFMDFMNFCRIGINRDWWWSLYWSSLLQQHCNTKTRMHKSQNIGNAIALRTAKLESREVMRQVRRGFFLDFDFQLVRVQDVRSSSHWPKRTSISGT